MSTLFITLSDGSTLRVRGVDNGDGTADLAVAGTGSDGATVIERPARIARTAHLTSAALPAAGAYTNQGAYSIPDGVVAVTFYVTYTRGTTNGQAKFKIMVGNGTEEGTAVVVDATVTASEPFSQQTMRGGEFPGPVPQSSSAVTFAVPVELPGGPTTVRLLAAESGVTGTPGTCAITLTASY